MGASDYLDYLKEKAAGATDAAKEIGSNVRQRVTDAKDNAIESMSPEDAIRLALKIPAVSIDRNDFLLDSLADKASTPQINYALTHTPSRAGIVIDMLDDIADKVISDETRVTVATSAAAALPGGLVGVLGGAAADLVSFYAHIIRLCQKLCFLYGWRDKPVERISETSLILLIAVASGDSEAERELLRILEADHRVAQVNAFVPDETSISAMVRDKILTRLSLNVNRVILGTTAGKVIPVAGAITSSVITYNVLKPMARRLKLFLRSTPGATAYADVILAIEEAPDDANVVEPTYEP
jgi:hypothetical protein